MRTILYCALFMGFAQAGCKEEEIRGHEQASDQVNASVARVSAGEVVSGFKHGQLRATFDVEGFSISKHPVSLKQYRTCVDAGACDEPRTACANLEGSEEDVALCVGPENAQAYCSWSGGRLPVLNEWLLAARGQNPQRFAWGDTAPSCKQHPSARVALEDSEGEHVAVPAEGQTECGEPVEELLRVGRHEEGASSQGLEDVLLAKAELLGGDRATNFGACKTPDQACLVYGLLPGAIDSVRPLAADGAASATEAREFTPGGPAVGGDAYAFRCVWSEEGA